jgi:hypothetical protein
MFWQGYGNAHGIVKHQGCIVRFAAGEHCRVVDYLICLQGIIANRSQTVSVSKINVKRRHLPEAGYPLLQCPLLDSSYVE